MAETKQYLITVEEGKKLISRAVAQSETIQTAARDAEVRIGH